MCGVSEWGKMASASLPSGCFPYTKDLVYLRLLEKIDGGVELEYSKNIFYSVLDLHSALPFPVDVVMYL